MKTSIKRTIYGNSPAKLYWDYCFYYRSIKGRIKGCLNLLLFCNKFKKDNQYTFKNIVFIVR